MRVYETKLAVKPRKEKGYSSAPTITEWTRMWSRKEAVNTFLNLQYITA